MAANGRSRGCCMRYRRAGCSWPRRMRCGGCSCTALVQAGVTAVDVCVCLVQGQRIMDADGQAAAEPVMRPNRNWAGQWASCILTTSNIGREARDGLEMGRIRRSMTPGAMDGQIPVAHPLLEVLA